MGIKPDSFLNNLSNKIQAVIVDNIASYSVNITCGVPQGSIWGPLLYTHANFLILNSKKPIMSDKIFLDRLFR